MSNKLEPQVFSLDMLKKVMLCMSADVTRPVMNGINLNVVAPGICRITATDGHILLEYRNVCLSSVRELFKSEYGVNLKEVAGNDLRGYVIYPDHKRRKKLGKTLLDRDEVFPNTDRIIPDKKTCPSNINHLPVYHIDVLVTVKKITGRATFFPDYWTSATGASVKEIDDHGSLLLVMPVRAAKEWAHYDAWRERNATNN